MAFVTFAGLTPRDVDLVARAVLPKHYMEQLNALVYESLWLPARRKVAVTSAPRVMSEWFLKEYMAADAVVGLELQHVTVGRRRYFTGLLSGPATGTELMRQKALREALGGEDDPMADVGIISRSSSPLDQLFVPCCKVREYM
jgi:glycerol-3-phosphate acyltransferase